MNQHAVVVAVAIAVKFHLSSRSSSVEMVEPKGKH